jgi:hypothetical protein
MRPRKRVRKGRALARPSRNTGDTVERYFIGTVMRWPGGISLPRYLAEAWNVVLF